MCGRYSWKKPGQRRFSKLTKNEPKPGHPSLNRAPGQVHPTLSVRNGTVGWNAMVWGHPSARSQENHGGFSINARSETVAEKPTFRESFKKRRCLVPADGFYEWEVQETQKYPHFIHLPDHETFAMAGIWSVRTGSHPPEDAFAILTQSAHPDLLSLHHRMPVILQESDWEIWLDPASSNVHLEKILLRKGPQMHHYQVSKQVNSTKNDSPELQKPFSERQGTLF
jgi:putative SOS response-associated peptidase YedK